MGNDERKKIKAIFKRGVFVPIDDAGEYGIKENEIVQLDVDRASKISPLEFEIHSASGNEHAVLLNKLNDIIKNQSKSGLLGDTLIWRVEVENEIRKLKRLGGACPYLVNKCCTNLTIRCGERQQYNMRETYDDMRKPHKCNYQNKVPLSHCHILVVDDCSEVRKMCIEYLNTIGVENKKIVESASAEEAEEIMTKGKVEGKTYCIVISDINMKVRKKF
jgi:CheY-like chemotaxis protein